LACRPSAFAPPSVPCTARSSDIRRVGRPYRPPSAFQADPALWCALQPLRSHVPS
jgi:hypothetical protein